MKKLPAHARRIVEELAKTRNDNGQISTVESVELISRCGLKPGSYAKTFGQSVSLLDAACINSDLPWIGRAVKFKNKGEGEWSGIWAAWNPYKAYFLKAPLTRRWTDSDLTRILDAMAALPGPDKWWKEQEKQQNGPNLLQRSLLVVLRQAYDETSSLKLMSAKSDG